MMSTFLGAADAAEAAMAALEVALAEDRARPHADPFEASVRELTTAAVSRGAAAAERRRRGDTAAVAAYTPNYDAVTAHKPSARFGDAQRRGGFGVDNTAPGAGGPRADGVGGPGGIPSVASVRRRPAAHSFGSAVRPCARGASRPLAPPAPQLQRASLKRKRVSAGAVVSPMAPGDDAHGGGGGGHVSDATSVWSLSTSSGSAPRDPTPVRAATAAAAAATSGGGGRGGAGAADDDPETSIYSDSDVEMLEVDVSAAAAAGGDVGEPSADTPGRRGLGPPPPHAATSPRRAPAAGEGGGGVAAAGAPRAPAAAAAVYVPHEIDRAYGHVQPSEPGVKFGTSARGVAPARRDGGGGGSDQPPGGPIADPALAWQRAVARRVPGGAWPAVRTPVLRPAAGGAGLAAGASPAHALPDAAVPSPVDAVRGGGDCRATGPRAPSAVIAPEARTRSRRRLRAAVPGPGAYETEASLASTRAAPRAARIIPPSRPAPRRRRALAAAAAAAGGAPGPGSYDVAAADVRVRRRAAVGGPRMGVCGTCASAPCVCAAVAARAKRAAAAASATAPDTAVDTSRPRTRRRRGSGGGGKSGGSGDERRRGSGKDASSSSDDGGGGKDPEHRQARVVTTARAATAASAAQAAQAAADALHARGGGRRARRELARAALEASHRAEGKGADSDSGGGGGGKSDGGSGSRRGYAFQLHARDGGGSDSEDWLSDSDDEVRAKVARERAAARVARGGPRAGGDVSDGASGSDVGVLSTHPRARGATIAPPRGAVLTARERRGAARAAAAASAARAVGYHDVSHAATEPRTSGGPTFAAAAAAAAATAAELVAARARAAAAAPRRSVSADAPEAGDWTSANLPREWARPAHGGPPAWVHPDDAAGAAARARREAAEATAAAAFDWLGPQTHREGDAVAAAARGSGVIDFAAGAGRDVVLARARDDVVVVAFADPASVAAAAAAGGAAVGPALGPGAYAVDAPALLDQFAGQRRAPAASFGAAPGRAEAVGPFGDRPPAYADSDATGNGDVLDLEPGPARGSEPPAFTFARAELPRGEDAGAGAREGEGDTLILDAAAADAARRAAARGHRYVSFASQLGRPEPAPDGEGDVVQLELKRKALEPRPRAAEFGRAAGRDDGDARDADAGNVLILDVDGADAARRRRARAADLSRGDGHGGGGKGGDEGEPEGYVDAEYEVKEGIALTRPRLAVGHVVLSQQPVRWAPAKAGPAPGDVLDLAPRPGAFDGAAAGVVEMDKQPSRWEADASGDGLYDEGGVDGGVLDLDTTLERRVLGVPDLALGRDRWPKAPPPDVRAPLDVARADKLVRKPVITAGGTMDVAPGRGRGPNAPDAPAPPDSPPPPPPPAPSVEVLSTFPRAPAPVSMARTSGRSTARADAAAAAATAVRNAVRGAVDKAGVASQALAAKFSQLRLGGGGPAKAAAAASVQGGDDDDDAWLAAELAKSRANGSAAVAAAGVAAASARAGGAPSPRVDIDSEMVGHTGTADGAVVEVRSVPAPAAARVVEEGVAIDD